MALLPLRFPWAVSLVSATLAGSSYFGAQQEAMSLIGTCRVVRQQGLVMPVFTSRTKDVDGRDKPGHDE
jgi:hypothetical protein